MDEAIIPRATIRQRDSHNMNWHSSALAEWLVGFDQAAEDWHAQLMLNRESTELAEVSPP